MYYKEYFLKYKSTQKDDYEQELFLVVSSHFMMKGQDLCRSISDYHSNRDFETSAKVFPIKIQNPAIHFKLLKQYFTLIINILRRVYAYNK